MLLPTQAPFLAAFAVRQDAHVITQTLTRDGAAMTTVVTLGIIPTDTSDEGTAPEANIYGHDSGLSPAELGAILGSVAAFILIVLIGFFCFANAQRQKRRVRVSSSYDSSFGSDSVVEVTTTRARARVPPRMPRRPPPVAERIPGGPKYPTYRALPIKNPRKNPRVPHNFGRM